MEAAQVFSRLLPCRSHFTDRGGGWATPERRQQTFERWTRSLGHDFDIAILPVASVAPQTQCRGFAHHEIAKADALHAPAHEGMKFLYIRALCFALVHGLYDSIVWKSRIVLRAAN